MFRDGNKICKLISRGQARKNEPNSHENSRDQEFSLCSGVGTGPGYVCGPQVPDMPQQSHDCTAMQSLQCNHCSDITSVQSLQQSMQHNPRALYCITQCSSYCAVKSMHSNDYIMSNLFLNIEHTL